MSERLTELPFEAHACHGAKIHAFVVMPEHVHCITLLPADMNISKFLHSLKKHTAHELPPLLNDKERLLLQRRKGVRAFWMRSFHGLYVYTDKVIDIKVDYMHENPVRRGLCEFSIGYRWSSARTWQFGPWEGEFGFTYESWLESVSALPIALRAKHPNPLPRVPRHLCSPW